MNIVYINHYAGSPALGMEFRPYYLAREWVRSGHAVQMLAASHSHVRSRQPEAGDQQIDGVHYRWYPTPAYAGNGLKRLRNIAAFLRAVWADTPRLLREFKPDVVIASSTYPMDFWVARRLARRAGAQLVFEVHDLWPLSPIELSGMSPRHPFALLCSWAESSAYAQADVVVSMLPMVQAYMASRGLDLRKLHIVPNGISAEDWSADQQGTAEPLREDVALALATARSSGATVVGYAGSMGLPNALDNLLDAAALLKAQPSHQTLSFVLVGGGHEQQRLAQRVQTQGLHNVQMLPPIPKAQIPAFLVAIDIAYIGWQRVPIYRFGIAPNKLMDYMMARAPVLHAVEAGNDPVAEAGAGFTVAPEQPAAVASGLLRLAALPLAERQAMGERGRAFVLAHHTYPVLAQRFLAALR
jgi:glycosyltransferase involved in cell wall biosynthesis